MKALSILTAAALHATLHAQEPDVFNPESWPRSYKVGNSEIAIYMPQIVEWTEFRHLKANAAIGVKLDGAAEATFGAAEIVADTVTDLEHRSVRIGKRTVDGFRFPEFDGEKAKQAETLVRSVIRPDSPLEIPLDAMTAAVERGDASTGDTAVSFEPPPIFHSDSPALLVVFVGEPKLEPVKDDDPSVMFAINTNWDLLSAGGSYYLLAGDRWLTTGDLLKGAWTAATSLPDSFQKLPDDGNWSEVKAKLFILPDAGVPPKVVVSNRPAEMIVTDGKPRLAPISGTTLMYVLNTESDVFLDAAGKNYYFLTSGRWFASPSLDGPWSAASESLPDDFRRIPSDHPKAHVLASVKGTPEADEAVILASIPQTATVDRSSTKLEVPYDGEPQFKPIPGAAGVSFAVNTSYDVFEVSKQYYCCHQGVWFQATTATGKWIVCDKVPDPIYGIPPQSPKHNVTYVHVYDSSPTTVQVGTTSGYSGSYVANGLLVFGLGMWLGHELADDDIYWHGHLYPGPHWYGYGCGAVYHPGSGYYRRGANCYGPYGGAGYAAAYNPQTGTYARGAYAYGPYRAVGAKAAYNPWTNTAAGRVGASGPYGSWGRSAVVRDDEWIRAGHRSNPYGTVGGIQTSRGGAAVGVDRKYGPDGFVGKTGSGDVYVGKDGNFYRRTDDGWQKRQNGGWQGAPDVPVATPYRQAPATRPAPERETARPAPTGTTRAAEPTRPSPPARQADVARPAPKRPTYQNRQSNVSQLNRDAHSRQRSKDSGGSRHGGGGRRR